MIEGFDPRLARDLVVRMPHVASTQEAAEGHHCDKMACHGWGVRAIAGHHPELWNNCNSSDKEATHPQGVENRSVVKITVEQGSKNQGTQCKGGHWKRVIISFIRLGLNVQHPMQEPENHS